MDGSTCRRLAVVLGCLGALGPTMANEVANGSFETAAEGTDLPAQWQAAGAAEIEQRLSRDVGRDGQGFAARLTCTRFAGGSPSAHAMLCQVGVVGLRRGTWYRLSFWARGEDIAGEAIDIAISNTVTWANTGLADAVDLSPEWRRYELFFQASQDVEPADSRLQFWFRSTGTLWLDEVELVPTEMKAQYHPQWPAEGRVNLLPNSSFECGTAGWGSYAPNLGSWTGNVYRQLGEPDDGTAVDGRQSLRLQLSAQDAPVFHFDWFDPTRTPVRTLLAAHQGWVFLPKGEACTFSAWMKADQAGTAGLLLVRQAGARALRQALTLTTTWQRYAFTFTAETDQAWVAVGLDLAAAPRDQATVWVDAVQLERGAEATPYQPGQALEVWVSTTQPGNLFTAGAGAPALPVTLRAHNPAAAPVTTTVTLAISDFHDREIARQEVALALPAGGRVTQTVSLATGGLGFFRVHLTRAGRPMHPPLRAAILPPATSAPARFGMNHAYPWDFLLPLAQQGGVTWWRDWSVQWRTVQAAADADFDFREPDIQIGRVLDQGGHVLVLFPFPSSTWASTATPEAIDKVARAEHERRRVPLAFKPRDEEAFTRYIAANVRHYRDRVTAYQVFNEALYTSYSLPASGGHTVEDYVHLLRLAYTAIKAEQPEAVVVGGLGIWADSQWTRDFVEADGMQHLDVLDLHLYPRGRPEPYAAAVGALRRRLEERHEVKPIWVTEIGCYADDDPPKTPMAASFGDAAMRRALHPGEREATIWLVTFATLTAAEGVERLFLHAGTCGEINGIDAGGVLFEYGGTPRKMLPGIAVCSQWLPATARFERREILAEKVTAYWFRTPAGAVAVAWSSDGRRRAVPRPAGVRVFDLMGNLQAPGPGEPAVLSLDREPVYLVRP